MRRKHTTIRPWTLKQRAHGIVYRAIRAGKLPHARTQACTDCGKRATEYDHRDYDKPLEMQPVCHSCNTFRGPAYGSNARSAPRR